MSTVSKISDAQTLRIKAQRTCAISGIQGTHTLQIGVAYFYRGHYIYACPAGNPIEPIPYSTKKGISIIGTVVDRAPLYDAFAKGLVYEPDISALERAVLHAKEDQCEQEAKQNKEVAKALKQEESHQHVDAHSVEKLTASAGRQAHSQPASRMGSSTMLSRAWQHDSHAKSQTTLASFVDRLVASPSDDSQIGTFNAPSMPSLTAYAPSSIGNALVFTPHDRAQFLAYSAPGSRLVSGTNTPYTSRPVTPTHGLGPRGLLRTIASTSRLSQLLNEAGVRRDLNPLPEFSEECYTHEELDAIIKNLPHPSSRPQSRAHAPIVLGDADNSLYHRGPDPFDAPYAPPRTPSPNLPNAYMRSGDCPPSGYSTVAQPPSRDHSPASTISYDVPNRYLYLPGLGHTENPPQQRGIPGISSIPSQETLHQGSSFASQETLHHALLPSPTYWLGDKPLGLGRPRKASIVLNETYNAANPPRPHFDMLNLLRLENANDTMAARSLSSVSSHCASSHCATDGASPQLSVRTPKCPMPFHDDSCDGITTTNKHLTAQAREGKGFKDLYPTIVCQDERMMIDWDTMMREERAAFAVGVGVE